MRCESGENTTKEDNTTTGDSTMSAEKITSGDGDPKPMPSGDVASSSGAAVLVPTQGTPNLWDPK